METENQIVIKLDEKQARIIACLMEKQLTTPNAYPLTLNNLVLACNQKSNREPTMTLTEGEVGHIGNSLMTDGLIQVQSGERTKKYAQLFSRKVEISQQQQSLLTVMMLRAPQTLNDLKRRTERMADFTDLDEIQLVLLEMLERSSPLVQHLPKGPGQREDRYWHTLGEWTEDAGQAVKNNSAQPVDNEPVSHTAVTADYESRLQNRISELEQRVATLESLVHEQNRESNEAE